MAEKTRRVGFIGLGAMGLPMAQNLLKAGCEVGAYDIDNAKTQALAAQGGLPTTDPIQLVQTYDTIFTSLPSSEIFVQVAETAFVPHCRPDQLFIDMGTVMPAEVRRIGDQLRERQADILDAPVSGGTGGARGGSLRIFVGGSQATFQRALPLLSILGDSDHLHYCGENGTGQITKFVNQMAMGLTAAAHLEALALGVRAGIDAQLLADAIGGGEHWRAQFQAIAQQIVAGRGNHIGVKVGQMPYFIEVAHEGDFDLPLSQALYAFCQDAPPLVTEANRPSPSFWHELMKGALTNTTDEVTQN